MSDELEALLRIEKLLRSLIRISLAQPMKDLLATDELRELYLNTGKLKRQDLEKRTGFSAGKISGLWTQWEQAGLLIRDGKSFKKPFE